VGSLLTEKSKRRRETPDARRKEILEAACRMITERGADRVRMADVARRAGVSPGLLHYYFATRSELLRAAFLYADQRVLAFEERVAASYPPVEALRLLLLSYLDRQGDILENWVLWREMGSHCLTEPSLRPAFRDVYVSWVDLLAGIIQRGQAGGDVPQSVEAKDSAWRLSAQVEMLESHLLLGILDKRYCTTLVLGGIERELMLDAHARGD
jgi:AcrR family transcriptional regulator